MVILITQLIGEFGLRENVYYGAIFLSMTFIVLFCFLIVNRFISSINVIKCEQVLLFRTSHGSNFHNAHQAIYDMGETT